MKWSKLKQAVENNFADCIKGRVCIYSTRYTTGSYFMVRGWITIDKIEIANFSTPDNANKYGWNTPDIDNRIPIDERKPGVAVEKGEFSKWDLISACLEYLNMNIDEASASINPIIRSFAMIDRRFGKRRLKQVEKSDLHPLVLRMLMLRLECENIITKRD